MKRFLLFATGILILAWGGFALADYTIKDSTGATKTVFAFVCFTTKICPSSVPIDSAGGDMTDTTNHAMKVVNPTAANLNVTEASAASILTAVQAAIPPGTNIIGYTSNDPCMSAAKTNLSIDSNTTALTQIIAASGSTKIYICSLSLIAAAATTVTFNTGTGTNCGTGTAGLIGGTTVANSISLAANGGLTYGNGLGTVAVTAASGEVCMALGTSVYVAGNMTYVQQ